MATSDQKTGVSEGERLTSKGTLPRKTGVSERERLTPEDERSLGHAMSALKAIYGQDIGKPKSKKRASVKKKKKKIVTPAGKEEQVEVEEFAYDWDACVCGMSHPPIPEFRPPRGKRCLFYWQIAEKFPYMTIYRVLTTEQEFKKADTDNSGLIDVGELKNLLRDSMGPVTDKMVEKTFKEIDTDDSGSLDFGEVLGIVDTLVQRRKNKLPERVQKDFSKVCTIQ